MKKNFIAYLGVLILLLSSTTLCFASEATLEKASSDGYILFSSGNERIASDGKFDFECTYSVSSEAFKFDKTTAKITAKAQIINRNGDVVTDSYPNATYTIKLYKKGGGLVATGNFSPDSGNQSFNVTVDTSTSYYFEIATGGQKLPSGTNLTGSGTITNFIKLKQ